jgi:hypothetical protein
MTSATALEATQSGDEAAFGPATASAAVVALDVWGGALVLRLCVSMPRSVWRHGDPDTQSPYDLIATTHTGGCGDGAGSSGSMGQSPHMYMSVAPGLIVDT